MVLGNTPVRVFKTQIKENASFSAAWPYADRHAHARDDLQSVLEVVGPSNSGVQENGGAPFRSIGRCDCLTPANDRLQQGIEALMRQPYEALAEIVTERGGAVPSGIVCRGNVGRAEIPMCHQLLAQQQADRHHGLNSRTA